MVRKTEILQLRHAWPEKAGFEIRHKKNREDYIFIHFHTPVTLKINDVLTVLQSHACVILDKDSSVFFKSNYNLIHDWMHFTGNIWEILASYGLETDKIYYPKTTDYITEIIRELEVECFSKKSYFVNLCDSKIQELFIKLARNAVLDETDEIIPGGVVKKFVDLRAAVFANLSYNWSVPLMAHRINLSESRFYTLYKQIFGISPKNDLICARIALAKNLLQSQRYTVDKVAELTGYISTFNFIRQFKKSVGITPGEYKHNLGG